MNNTPTWEAIAREYAYLKRCENRLKSISSLPNCNNCAVKKNCTHVPKLGEDARFNCFAHVPEEGK